MASASKGFSLVKYDTPILVSKSFGKKTQASGASSVSTSAGSNRSKEDPA